MKNALIYHRSKKYETNEDSITYVKNLIKQLKQHYVIRGVFVDSYNDRSEFYNLINGSLGSIDVVFINNSLIDEFDRKLLDELARAEGIIFDSRNQN